MNGDVAAPAPAAPSDPRESRGRILQIEAALKAEIDRGAVPETTHAMPLRHMFIPGGYARELTIPAGTIIVGKIHKGPCFNFITQGRIAVVTEEGRKLIEAPASFVSPPGVKRVGLALTDTIWTTVHVTDKTDVSTIEDELTVATFEEFDLLAAGGPTE